MSEFVAKLREATRDARIYYIRLTAFGLTLVESPTEASRWTDPTEAWKYAELASQEFGMAFIAIPLGLAFNGPASVGERALRLIDKKIRQRTPRPPDFPAAIEVLKEYFTPQEILHSFQSCLDRAYNHVRGIKTLVKP
jgi:hypothetical protein